MRRAVGRREILEAALKLADELEVANPRLLERFVQQVEAIARLTPSNKKLVLTS